MSNHIFFFGDSICVGQWISIDKTWVARIGAAVSSSNFVVHNRSINGNTSRQALERMHFDVLSQIPYGVIIQFGLNDANIWASDRGYPRISIKAYEANILEMIDRCRYFDVNLIILNSNHPTTRNHTPLPNSDYCYEEMNERYYEVLQKIALSQKDIHFFDINNIFKKNIPYSEWSEYLLEDEIHLSQKGHDFYFYHFHDFLFKKMQYVNEKVQKKSIDVS